MSVREARMSITLPLPSSPHWPPTSIAVGIAVSSSSGLALRPLRRLPGGVDEAGLVLEEEQGDVADGAVAVLGHDQLGLVAVDLFVVEPLPVDEHDQVGVLLDGARLAQVRELGPVVAALLGRAVE